MELHPKRFQIRSRFVLAPRRERSKLQQAPRRFVHCSTPPGTVAARLGVSPSTAIYSISGGDQPQALGNEFSARLQRGEHKAVLLCGSEATAAAKAARRANLQLDWSASIDAPFEDRGLGPMLLTDYEIKNGLGWPAQTYP